MDLGSVTRRIAFSKIHEDFRKKTFTEIPFELNGSVLDTGAQHFLSFLELPRKEKEKFFRILDHKDDASQIGYQARGKEKRPHGNDRKEYFHYNRHAEDLFRDFIDLGNAVIYHFFESARSIYHAAEQTMRDVVRALDIEYSGIYQEFFPEDKHPKCYLRFLKYYVRGRGNFLARGHYDRGGLTFALRESAPGLRIGRHDHLMQNVARSDGSVILMPAYKICELIPLSSCLDYWPAWHEVVQAGSDALSAEIARWAIVFFADPYYMEPVSDELTHKPIYNPSLIRARVRKAQQFHQRS